jgi:para-nitrobenzyl esterase
MNATWRAFAATGSPNGSGLTQWPRYDGQQIMEFTPDGTKVHPENRNVRLDGLAKLIDPKS